MNEEAQVTVQYRIQGTTLQRTFTCFCDTFREPTFVAEEFEKQADRAVEAISDLLQHIHGGRAHPNEPPAVRRRLSNRQKLDLIQELLDADTPCCKHGGNPELTDRIRGVLKR